MTSDLQYHLSDDAFSPMGALRYLNLPCGSRNVVMSEFWVLVLVRNIHVLHLVWRSKLLC